MTTLPNDYMRTKHEKILSILPPEFVFEKGLIAEAMIGAFDDSGGFHLNRQFVDFMQRVIASRGPEDRSLREAAARHGDGWTYLVDSRTPNPAARLEDMVDDIIGAFEVKNGSIVPGSYAPNRNYLPFSKHGMMQLPGTLREMVISELMLLYEKRQGEE